MHVGNVPDMLDRNDIPYVHWQMKSGPDGAVMGDIAAELDDLDQCIRQCLLTPKNSVPLDPERGCDLEAYRDRPLNVRHVFMAAEVREALARDVPRIKVHELVVDVGFSQAKLKVVWTPIETVLSEFITTAVSRVI